MSYCDKSAENFTIARFSFDKGKYNAAASRLYYSLYQACVGELNGKGKTAGDFLSEDGKARLRERASTTDVPMWPHHVVTEMALANNGLELSPRERTVVKQAKALRVKGDYGDNVSVTADDLLPLLEDAPRLLRSLGVLIE